jgi:hypothetical protein
MKDVSHNPWKFDAVGQAEGLGNATVVDADDAETNFPIRPYIDLIMVDAGAAGGTYEVTDIENGNPLTGVLTVAANTTATVSIGKYTDGVYVAQIGDGQILVYHGREA